jgi:uncharacterized protein YndB with AHSA1/START domain
VSIHQETLVPAPPERVFELLTGGAMFGAATGQPAQITDREGDAFSLFDGRVEGRQIELVPGRRVVQRGASAPRTRRPGRRASTPPSASHSSRPVTARGS